MRDARDDIVETVDMLDINGGINIDPGGQQFLDIEVAFRVTAFGRVRMSEFVDQNELGMARQNSVDIHLRQDSALIDHVAAGNDFEAGDECFCFGAAVGFDDAHDHIDTLAPLGLGHQQHFISFADSRGRTKKNLEPSARAVFGLAEQGLGRRPFVAG